MGLITLLVFNKLCAADMILILFSLELYTQGLEDYLVHSRLSENICTLNFFDPQHTGQKYGEPS